MNAETSRRPFLASAFLPETVGPVRVAPDGRVVVGRQAGEEGWWQTLMGRCVCPLGSSSAPCPHEMMARKAGAKLGGGLQDNLNANRARLMSGDIRDIVRRMGHGKAPDYLASSGIVSWAITHPEAQETEWRTLARVGISRVGRMLLRHPMAAADSIVRESLWKLAKERFHLFEGQEIDDRLGTIQLWLDLGANWSGAESQEAWAEIKDGMYEFYVPVASFLAKRAALQDNRTLLKEVLQSKVRLVREEAIKHLHPKDEILSTTSLTRRLN